MEQVITCRAGRAGRAGRARRAAGRASTRSARTRRARTARAGTLGPPAQTCASTCANRTRHATLKLLNRVILK